MKWSIEKARLSREGSLCGISVHAAFRSAHIMAPESMHRPIPNKTPNPLVSSRVEVAVDPLNNYPMQEVWY